MRARPIPLFLLALALPWARAGAQRIRGDVLFPDSTTRAPGIIIVATDAGNAVAARTLSAPNGRFELVLHGAGRYTVRALRVGFRPTTLPPIDLGASDVRTIRVILGGVAIAIAPVTVRGRNVCHLGRDSGQVVAGLWEEARKALTATQLSAGGERLVARWVVYERTTDPTGRVVLSEQTTAKSGYTDRPFVSVSPDSLARFGYVVDGPGGTTYRAPDAGALLSDSFVSSHCFHVEPPSAGQPSWIGVGFRPAEERVHVSDIEGTLWLDRQTAELRQLEFRYTQLPDAFATVNLGGTVEFIRLATGNWLVNRWSIRMPRATRRAITAGGHGGSLKPTTRLVVDGLQIAGGDVRSVQRGTEVLYPVAPDSATGGRRVPHVDPTSAPPPGEVP